MHVSKENARMPRRRLHDRLTGNRAAPPSVQAELQAKAALRRAWRNAKRQRQAGHRA